MPPYRALRRTAAAIAAIAALCASPAGAQTPLDATTLTKFVDPLPVPGDERDPVPDQLHEPVVVEALLGLGEDGDAAYVGLIRIRTKGAEQPCTVVFSKSGWNWRGFSSFILTKLAT